MACNDTNPCDPCNEHDNCGCLNPTTFGCVTTNKTRDCLDVTSGTNGEDILDAIETKVCDIGKVLIDGDDTCPEFLFEKLEEGLNISFAITGTGCDRKIQINATEGGVPVDINAKVTSADTTTGYLNTKIETGSYLTKTILNPAGNEKLEIDVVPETLISGDTGNQIVIGDDGGLKTLYTAPDGSETIIVQGTGVLVSGSGTTDDPYVIATNPSIQIARACFDNTWRNISLVASGNPNVVYTAGTPQYRYRFDGTVEFRGSITYQVAFGAYSTSNRKFTIPMGNIPTTCLTGGEQAGTADLKGINYIDVPQAGPDQYGQMYGYIIRKNAQNLILEFQSSFLASTSKTVVVNMEGAVAYPTI